MQSITVEGYLAADPSILSAQGSGAKRASFRILETTRFRKASGERGERTTGFNCVCFNAATTENYIAPFARKGGRVVVQGHVENDSWTGRDGTLHYDLRLVVHDLRLKNRRDAAAPDDEPRSERVSDPATDRRELDDEIPF